LRAAPKEAAELDVAHLQQRDGHWATVDLVGMGRHIRTVPIPDSVKSAIDSWLLSGGVSEGRVFRCVCRAGKPWGAGVTERVVWHVVKDCAKKAAIGRLAPHDLRRTCARLCRDAGGELDQIQFVLGHVSVQTTERYLSCEQRVRGAVNDRIGIEP
jgi:integrase